MTTTTSTVTTPTWTRRWSLVGRLMRQDSIAIHLQGHTGDFYCSRVLRLRLPLASVCGARLHAPGVMLLPAEEARALLVLELDSPPPERAFAARKVSSAHHGEKEFATVPDWTCLLYTSDAADDM
eukprot:7381497-Prymnesium_polylepis.3